MRPRHRHQNFRHAKTTEQHLIVCSGKWSPRNTY